MNFLPYALFGYALVGASLLVNKIQIQTKQINPVSYTFYAGILQGFALLLIPFGFNLNFSQETLFSAIISGIFFVLALYTLFSALNVSELSVVGPLVGALNPLFSLLIGVLFFNHLLTSTQLSAFFVLLFGAAVLTTNLWASHNWFYTVVASRLALNRALILMILSGFLFGLSYIFLREAFLQSSFINGLVISRLSAAVFALMFLLVPKLKYQIRGFPSERRINPHRTLDTGQKLLFLLGQAASGGGNLAIFFAVALANPALVNSLFGVQYLVILIVALFLKNYPKLLDEKLTKGAIVQKSVGTAILSIGVYLLSK